MIDTYNTKKVNNISIIFTATIVFLLIIQSYIANGINEALDTGIKGISVIVLVVIIYFLPLNAYSKGLLFGIIPGVVIMALFYLTGFSIDKHYIIFGLTGLVALYFKKEILILFGTLMDALFIFVFASKAENLAGFNYKLADFIGLIVLFNGTIFLLYLLNHWGRKLVNEAVEKEMRVKALLGNLQITFEKLDESSKILDSDIDNFNSGILSSKQASMEITRAMEEMTRMIQEESTDITQINKNMVQSLDNVQKVREISKGVIDKSNDMKRKIGDGRTKVDRINNHMNVVDKAIGAATDTVFNLQKSMEDINHSLEGIEQISKQTNLLALNAAIESARAGEQGKGFSVVADEVRRLADQSSKIVSEIKLITKNLSGMSQEAFNLVNQGYDAVKEETNLMGDISVYFKEIEQTFGETNKKITKGMEMMEDVGQNFEHTQIQLDNVSVISEENVASVEEVLANVENENHQIAEISNSVEGVKDLSKKLKNMITGHDNT